MSTRIIAGDTEPIEVTMLDGSLSELTGLSTVLLSIRRTSDDFWYDFNDKTFKNSLWTTRQQVMSEVDATNDPGVYAWDFDTSLITNATADDTYMLRIDEATVAANVPLHDEIHVDQWVQDLFDEHGATQTDVAGVQSDTDNIQTRLPAALVSGRMDSSVGAMAAGVVTAAAIATDAVDADALAADAVAEIQSGLATAAALSTVETNLLAQHTATQAAIAALNDLSMANVQTALDNQGYTAVRAALLDNLSDLDASITSVLSAITALNDLSSADVQAAMTAQGYSTVRAALLDNLDAAVSAVISAVAALNDLSSADVQAAMTSQGYTVARAPGLDNLDAAVSSRSSHDAADVDTQLSGVHGAGSWETATGFASPGDAMDLIAGAVDAAAIATDAIDADALAADAVAEIQSGLPTGAALSSVETNLLAQHTATQTDIAALNDLSSADIQAALTAQGYTPVRAALLDFLDAAISGIPAAVDVDLTSAHGVGSWQSGDAAVAGILVALDESTSIMYFEVWLERNAMPVADGDLVSCSVEVYDKDGTLLFTVTSSTPDGNGRFSIERSSVTLTADRPYVMNVTVTDTTGAVTSIHSFAAVS